MVEEDNEPEPVKVQQKTEAASKIEVQPQVDLLSFDNEKIPQQKEEISEKVPNETVVISEN